MPRRPSQPTEPSFLKDVARHEMSIIFDQGTTRRIRFKQSGTYHMWFDIVTWPGFLCISGDMGCFVFSRIEDMFEFFRGRHNHEGLEINTGYWAEKLEATKRHNGHEEFSAELFTENVKRWMDEREVSAATRAEVEDLVLRAVDDGEFRALNAAIDFKSTDGFRFNDFWEVNNREYTYHYVWCCYAIVWAIRQYDRANKEIKVAKNFQERVAHWMSVTFDEKTVWDTAERNHRFLEESLELVQARGGTAAEAHMLVDYVFGRQAGEPHQETGGVMVTLAALCNAAAADMMVCAETELARCYQNIEKIRAKQKGKPPSSPLPEHTVKCQTHNVALMGRGSLPECICK